jgi:hypothetical protein
MYEGEKDLKHLVRSRTSLSLPELQTSGQTFFTCGKMQGFYLAPTPVPWSTHAPAKWVSWCSFASENLASYDTVLKICGRTCTPSIAVSTLCRIWTAFDTSNTGFVGSNPNCDEDICSCSFSFGLSCVGSRLVAGWPCRLTSSCRTTIKRRTPHTRHGV